MRINIYPALAPFRAFVRARAVSKKKEHTTAPSRFARVHTHQYNTDIYLHERVYKYTYCAFFFLSAFARGWLTFSARARVRLLASRFFSEKRAHIRLDERARTYCVRSDFRRCLHLPTRAQTLFSRSERAREEEIGGLIGVITGEGEFTSVRSC